jgi:hypothetical protein
MWTDEDDKKLLSLHMQLGAAWGKYTNLFPGRTASSIKNRFYVLKQKLVNMAFQNFINGTDQTTCENRRK